MATVDKQSVREEFDKIKSNFQVLVKAGKVSSDVAILFSSLMMLFNIILAIFLERKTKKHLSIPVSHRHKLIKMNPQLASKVVTAKEKKKIRKRQRIPVPEKSSAY